MPYARFVLFREVRLQPQPANTEEVYTNCNAFVNHLRGWTGRARENDAALGAFAIQNRWVVLAPQRDRALLDVKRKLGQLHRGGEDSACDNFPNPFVPTLPSRELLFVPRVHLVGDIYCVGDTNLRSRL